MLALVARMAGHPFLASRGTKIVRSHTFVGRCYDVDEPSGVMVSLAETDLEMADEN
jgi:hypothetical protein